MKNDMVSLLDDADHTGFEDFLIGFHDKYPKDCFEPREYYTRSGTYKYNESEEDRPEISSILLEKANKKYERKLPQNKRPYIKRKKALVIRKTTAVIKYGAHNDFNTLPYLQKIY